MELNCMLTGFKYIAEIEKGKNEVKRFSFVVVRRVTALMPVNL